MNRNFVFLVSLTWIMSQAFRLDAAIWEVEDYVVVTTSVPKGDRSSGVRWVEEFAFGFPSVHARMDRTDSGEIYFVSFGHMKEIPSQGFKIVDVKKVNKVNGWADQSGVALVLEFDAGDSKKQVEFVLVKDWSEVNGQIAYYTNRNMPDELREMVLANKKQLVGQEFNSVTRFNLNFEYRITPAYSVPASFDRDARSFPAEEGLVKFHSHAIGTIDLPNLPVLNGLVGFIYRHPDNTMLGALSPQEARDAFERKHRTCAGLVGES